MKKVFVFAGVSSVAQDLINTLKKGRCFTLLIGHNCPATSIEEKIDEELKKVQSRHLISEVRSAIDFGKGKAFIKAIIKEIADTATDEVILIIPREQYLAAIKSLEARFKKPATLIASHYFWEVSDEVLNAPVPA